MKTVFVLEPDAILAKQYVAALDAYDVRVFNTASSAIKAFEQTVPDVVVLELALPGHGGFEFLYEMISYLDTAHVKVVINSSVQPDAVPWGIINRDDLQIVEHLYKPKTSVEDLLQVIKEAST